MDELKEKRKILFQKFDQRFENDIKILKENELVIDKSINDAKSEIIQKEINE